MARGERQLERAAETTARATAPGSRPAQEGPIDRVDLTAATLDRLEGAQVYRANLAVFRTLAETDPTDLDP
jgi:hypothetical protein